MKISYNAIFTHLLTAYNLPDDFSFTVDLPSEVQNILEDKIILTELGVTLQSFNTLYQVTQDGENQSIIEDSENHFRVFPRPFRLHL